ncbi:MAG TPA: hypothetical protein QGH10_14430 [Armatimonadota bacterium]|nr:hypothetical protein [Armatimonadota bacterium]
MRKQISPAVAIVAVLVVIVIVVAIGYFAVAKPKADAKEQEEAVPGPEEMADQMQKMQNQGSQDGGVAFGE